MRLYEVPGLFRKLDEFDIDPDNEDDVQALREMFDEIMEGFETKVENIVMVIKNKEADIEGIEGEIARLNKRKRSISNTVERLKEYIKLNMESCGIEKVPTSLFSVVLQKNPPSVEVEDEKQILDEFFVVKREISKSLLKEALKIGPVAGAKLVQNKSLRIK